MTYSAPITLKTEIHLKTGNKSIVFLEIFARHGKFNHVLPLTTNKIFSTRKYFLQVNIFISLN